MCPQIDVPMPIPDYQKCMRPLLQVLSDDQEHRFADVVDAVGEYFNLTQAERSDLLPSGNQRIFDNRMGWARTYLAKAGLIQYPRRGYSKITPRGKEVLSSNTATIDNKTLLQFAEFLEFWNGTVGKEKPEATKTTDASAKSSTPAEQLESAYLELRRSLASELLELVLKIPPTDFEHLVIELLVRIDTDGRLVWTRVHREFFRDHPAEFDFRPPGKTFVQEYAKFIAHKNEKLGSAGRLPEIRKALVK